MRSVPANVSQDSVSGSRVVRRSTHDPEKGADVEPRVVRFEGDAIIHLPHTSDATVRIELIGGRHRHSVGGQIAEGQRWWHGRIIWKNRARTPHLDAGNEVRVELPNGRTATAIVENTTADPLPEVTITGFGPPPFEVT